VACIGDRTGAYRILVERLDGKSGLGIPSHRWEANTEINPQEMVRRGKDLVDLSQNRDRWREFVNAVMNLEVCHPRCVCVCVKTGKDM